MNACLFMVGPSGGHLFPFIRVVSYLRRRKINIPITFSGYLPPYLEEIVRKMKIPYIPLPLRNRSEGKTKFYSHLITSFLKSISYFRKRFRILVSSGGYPSLVGGISAKLHGIPIVVYEPNVIPGKANLYLSKWASLILTGVKETSLFFMNKKIINVGIPIGKVKKSKKSSEKNLLILGGSQGSHLLNVNSPKILKEILPNNFNVIHISGIKDYEEVKKLYSNAKFNYEVYPFYYPMEEIYEKTDYCISRGGAITLSELSGWNIPTLVFPLITNYTSHQLDNAYYFKRFSPFRVGIEKNIQEEFKRFISCPPKKREVKREIAEEKFWSAISELVLSFEF